LGVISGSCNLVEFLFSFRDCCFYPHWKRKIGLHLHNCMFEKIEARCKDLAESNTYKGLNKVEVKDFCFSTDVHMAML
jgi:hypothetical protein